VSRDALVIRIGVVRRPLSALSTRALAAWTLAACLLALCGLPLSAGPALAGPVLAGPGRLAPGPGEWWFATWQVQRKVWPLSRGAGVTVAEVESGVQASIPDLRGVVLPGVDLTGGARNGDTDIQAGEDGHGTAMAVMIAGQGRGTGTVGIAPRAKILPVTVGGSGPRSVATAAAGIRYAAAHGAQVIDMPFGIGVTSRARCDPVLQAAVAYAIGRDVVLIASAGNTNLFTGPDEPASCAGVLAVGGTEPDGTLWPDSTREPYVAVAAPADHMVYVGRDGRFTTTGAGTSFAAALTAGAAALIRSRYPHMPWYQVDQRLTGTATPAGHPVPGEGYGYGIVNPARAVNASAYPVRASAPDPVLARYRAWLATPAGRTVAARYRLVRPGPPARAAAGAPPRGGGLRLRLPLGEITATAAAAACAFVAVLLAVLWISSRRARSRASGQWEARTWSFGPDEDDPPGWP
jgi:subtilisin family serine protease